MLTGQLNAAVAEEGEQVVDAHWPHIPTSPSPQLCPSPKTQDSPSEDPVLEVARRVADAVPKRPKVINPSATAQPLQLQTKDAVVVVLRAPVVVVVTVPAVEKLQLHLHLQLLLRYPRRTMLLRPRPRVWYLHRLVRALWPDRS